jgi:hypothetical protein
MTAYAQLVVTILFGGIAAILGFLAYTHTRDRFRLELFEKRWEIYESTLRFCSAVLQQGGIANHSQDEERNQRAINALLHAEGSFRGTGYHKTKSLFGDDIISEFNKINEAYAFFVAYSNREDRGTEETKRYYDHLKNINKTVGKLPDMFKPYMYFGDYKAKPTWSMAKTFPRK